MANTLNIEGGVGIGDLEEIRGVPVGFSHGRSL
jgi:hypothetical protein